MACRGCNVVVNGSTDQESCETVAEQARSYGVSAQVAMGDVGQVDSVRQIGETIFREFNGIDILVNNAAIRPEKPFLEMTAVDWHSVLDVDLHAAFYTCQTFLPQMIENSWGRVINITGMNAIHGYQGRAPVSAAKHGLWGLTKALAKEFGPSGITVNAISPGPIRSEHTDPEMTRHIEQQVTRIPVGHLGEPNHIASLCGYLVSDDGGFVSGQMIGCNGATET
jgi:3-oxoacyl-[acyl-carrier protein] reductase